MKAACNTYYSDLPFLFPLYVNFINTYGCLALALLSIVGTSKVKMFKTSAATFFIIIITH